MDLHSGKHLKSIRGLQEPQGVGFVSEFNKIYVANGKSGACDVLDGSSFERIKSVKFSDDADNIRYDAIGRRVYVGYGSGGLGIVDATDGNYIGNIKLDAHPESFQLEKFGPRIFVNLPDSKNRGR
ncbi:MAG: YncE family protein [Candidatus Binatia bacterium]